MALALPAPAAADHALAETWGTTGTDPGQLRTPTGLDTDAYDNVYVADYDNHRVQKFSPDGELLHSWGSLGSGDGQFNAPKDVAVDAADGHLYVADERNHRIQKFTLEGAHVATFGGTAGSGNGQFDHPYAVAAEGGYVYVADHDNNRIQRLTTGGTYDTQWGTTGTGDGQFAGPSGVAVTAGGTVYVTDYGNDRVQYFSTTGTFQGRWGATGTGDTQFNAPIAIAASSVGVFVVDEPNGRVTQFDADGDYLAKWESLTAPQGIATGTLNRFFVTDLQNRVLRFDGPVDGSVIRTSGTRLVFDADSGDTNNVTITRLTATTFAATDPGNSLTGGGGCTGTVGLTITCAFPAATTVSSIRVSTKDQADLISITGATPAVLDGGSGDDFLNGGESTSDVASYATIGGSGVTVDLSDAGPQDTGGAGTDTIQDVEGVTGTSEADTFTAGARTNTFSGGGGTDLVSYASLSGPAGVTVDLGAGTVTGGGALSGIENLTGSTFDDTLTGGPGVNALTCLGGESDTVTAEVQDTVDADCENVTRIDGAGGGDTGGGTGGGGAGGGAPAPGPGTTAPSAPVLSALAVKTMRTGKRGTFTYSLDKAAAVTISLARVQKGRKVGRACRKQTRRNRKNRSCTMFVTAGKLTQSGAAGRNTLAFSGKLKGRKLAPGIYRATAVATGSGGASKPVTATFVVRR